MPLLLCLIAVLFLAGCATDDHGPDERYANEIITRKDRNNDGVYDYELHHSRTGDEADWELVDNDYDGVFDEKIRYGYTVRREPVYITIPKPQG